MYINIPSPDTCDNNYIICFYTINKLTQYTTLLLFLRVGFKVKYFKTLNITVVANAVSKPVLIGFV